MARATALAIWFGILTFVAALVRAERPADSPWEPASGKWTIGASEGQGRSEAGDWAKLLSHEWYGDCELTGKLLGRVPQHAVALIVRDAGDSESYSVVVDWKKGRVFLTEFHFGESRNVLELGLGRLRSQTAVAFRIAAHEERLVAALWPDGEPDSNGVKFEYGDLKIPGGRAGLAVSGGELRYSSLALSGSTEIPYEPYAFHCNVHMPSEAAKQPLWKYLDAEGEAALARNRRTFGSVEEFEKYRRTAVLKLRQSLGLDPWPVRNNLNARLVGTLDRRGYRVEKIVFESQPGFLVNALLYVPKDVKFPAPGVLSTIGHYDDGLYLWSEQGRCIGLVKKGYVVLTFDPISQGERRWLGNGDHDRLRKKIILSGMEVSGLMFWDSIRAIDYLASRPEVDPGRIGVTGVSGGGFNALYTAVLDERVKAVAPDGFATEIEALIKRTGAGCCAYLPNLTRYAEISNVYSLIAPRQLLLLGGYMDVLSDRILDVYEQARAVYKLYGAEANLRYFLDRDGGHTYSKPMRLALYRWFNEWLMGREDALATREPMDPEDILENKDSGVLRVFAPGERGRDVIDLEREFLARNRVTYSMPANAGEAKELQAAIRERLLGLMGEMAPERMPGVSADDKLHGPGSVRHVVLRTERDLPVAVSIHHPAAEVKRGGLLLYFTMQERYPTATLGAQETERALVERGYTVAIPEVRGTWGTQVKGMDSVALFSMALGKHLFSSRIYDLRRTMDYLRAQPEYQALPLTVWGEGAREGLMALYLAAIDERVEAVVSSHGLVSYQNTVDNDGLPDFDYYVPGVLRYADVPQIIAAIAPRKVTIRAPVDIREMRVGITEAAQAYAFADTFFKVLDRPAAFSLAADEP